MLAELALLAAVASAPPPSEPTPTFVDEPVWVVSDDPCPYPGTSGTVPAGSSYEAGIWRDPEGNLIGAARFEDECVVLITDDRELPDADLDHDVTEVRVIDDQPQVVTFDTSAPTYDAPEGQLPLTR